MNPDLKKKVVADLEKTGFPAEFQVRRTIYSRAGRWDSTGTMGYFDLDENKLRQIDVYAFMPCGDRVSRANHTHTVWSLAIEVKRSREGKPWVVLKERRDLVREVLLWKHDLVAFCNLPADWDKDLAWRAYKHSFCKGMDWIGTNIHESFKPPSESSRAYGAMVSTVKAAEHFWRESHAAMKNKEAVTDNIAENPTQIIFVRPVVVLDGELLSAELDDAGELQVYDIDMAPMHVGYRSAHYDREKYRVDVVRLSALDSYLAAVEEQHDAIRKGILQLGGLDGFSESELIDGARPRKQTAELVHPEVQSEGAPSD